MKIIAIGDPHFRVDNIPEVDMFIQKMEALAKAESPDIIIILGDVLHTHERIHTIPLNKAYEFIQKMSLIAETYVLVGNHDYIQNQQFLTENHWMNGMKSWENVCIVDEVVHASKNNFNFVLCPYVPNGRFEEALQTLQGFDWRQSDCIFAHQEFYGCKMGAIVSVEGDKWDLTLPDVVSGHIHSRQKIQENIYYTGSALQHAFGESDKNIIAILTFHTPGERFVVEEHDLCLPRKKIMYLDIERVDAFEVPQTEDDIKLTLKGSFEEFKAFKKTEKYKDLTSKGMTVVFKSDGKKPSGMPSGMPSDEDEGANQKSKQSLGKTSEYDFKSILRHIVLEAQDDYLYVQYERVVNNHIVNADEQMIVIV